MSFSDGLIKLEMRKIKNYVLDSESLLTEELSSGMQLIKNPQISLNKLNINNHKALKQSFLR